MSDYNPNCDGGHCHRAYSKEVRLYPLGGGANLILCYSCWVHENLYRRNRGKETGRPEDWPQNDWATAQHYPA